MKKIISKFKRVGTALLLVIVGAIIWANYSNQIKSFIDDAKFFAHEKVHSSLQGVVDDMQP